MRISELDNLVAIGNLKSEPGTQDEFDGLVRSGRNRLSDARNKSLAFESRFDLAYNAAHALSLAALRWHGYRSANRYLVFQSLPHTLGLGASIWRILSKAHDMRNVAEYAGGLEVDERLLADIIAAATHVEEKVSTLGPLKT